MHRSREAGRIHLDNHPSRPGDCGRYVARTESLSEATMHSRPRIFHRLFTLNVIRLMLLALTFTATPNTARADMMTMNGLEDVAASVSYLAAAIAFAGIVVAIAIYSALKSRPPE